MTTPAWLSAIFDRIDQRDRRERLLLAGTLLVVVLVIWDMLLRAPLSERTNAAAERAQQLTRETASLRDSLASLQDQIRSMENESEPVLARLGEQLQAVDEKLAQRTARLISPQQMVAALRDVVESESSVRLVRLENHGAEPIISQRRDAVDGDGSAADVPRVYRHDVELVVAGTYLDLVAYLRRLEGLEWRFQWNNVSIATESYPTARATISLSTLSLAEDWIGV